MMLQLGMTADVSTHSRPKAAGFRTRWNLVKTAMFQHTAARRRLGYQAHAPSPMQCFNTQPPEGGWLPITTMCCGWLSFQHTAARRRLAGSVPDALVGVPVSTHSRPKAAGRRKQRRNRSKPVSTHSRPKAAGSGRYQPSYSVARVSTHSRPKAAGYEF